MMVGRLFSFWVTRPIFKGFFAVRFREAIIFVVRPLRRMQSADRLSSQDPEPKSVNRPG